MPVDDKNDDSKEDVEMKDGPEAEPAEASNGKTGADEVAEREEVEEVVKDQEPMNEEKEEPSAEKKESENNGDAKEDSEDEPKMNGYDALMDHTGKDDKNITEEGTGSKASKSDNAVEESPKREQSTPSSILEKGIIYFFFRGRVGINEPTDVNEVRTFRSKPFTFARNWGHMPLFASRNYLGIPLLGSNGVFLLPEMCYFSGFVLKKGDAESERCADCKKLHRPAPSAARCEARRWSNRRWREQSHAGAAKEGSPG